jgi:hypothetical protein
LPPLPPRCDSEVTALNHGHAAQRPWRAPLIRCWTFVGRGRRASPLRGLRSPALEAKERSKICPSRSLSTGTCHGRSELGAAALACRARRASHPLLDLRRTGTAVLPGQGCGARTCVIPSALVLREQRDWARADLACFPSKRPRGGASTSGPRTQAGSARVARDEASEPGAADRRPSCLARRRGAPKSLVMLAVAARQDACLARRRGAPGPFPPVSTAFHLSWPSSSPPAARKQLVRRDGRRNSPPGRSLCKATLQQTERCDWKSRPPLPAVSGMSYPHARRLLLLG